MAVQSRVTQLSVAALCTKALSRTTQLSATALRTLSLSRITQLSATPLTTKVLSRVTQLSVSALTVVGAAFKHRFHRLPRKPDEINGRNHNPNIRL
jgi:hypothetical protein